MKKIFKHLYFIGAVLLLSFLSSCADSDIIINNNNGHESYQMVSLRIVEGADADTRSATSRPIPGGEALQFNTGDLYLVTSAGIIIRHLRINAGNDELCLTTNSVGIERLTTPTGVQIPSVSGNVSRVVVVGNYEGTPLPTGGSINTITSRSLHVLSQHDAWNVNLMNCPTTLIPGRTELNGTLFDTGAISDDGLRIFSTTVHLAPTVARFELSSITGAQGSVAAFEVEGIFMDRHYRTANINGAIPGAGAASHTNFRSREQDATLFYLGQSYYTATSNNALFNWNVGAATAVPGVGVRVTPGTVMHNGSPVNAVWGYQVFAQNNATADPTRLPSIVIRLRNVYVYGDGGTHSMRLPNPQFVTVRGFRVASGLDAGTLLNGIRAGHVYSVSDVRFYAHHLDPDPNRIPIEVYVTVTLAHWNEEPVRPGMPLHQYNPQNAALCPGNQHYFNLVAATGGSGVFRYTWQRSDDNRATWTAVVTNTTNPHLTTPLLNEIMLRNGVWFRRVAIDYHTGNEIISSAARLALPARRYDFPDYVTIGAGANARRWATRNLDTPGTFVAHSSFWGRFYQWGTVGGVTHHYTPIDPLSPAWNTTAANSRVAWTATNDPCILARSAGSPNWRLPAGTNAANSDFSLLIAAGSVWLTQAQAGQLGFGCVPGRLFGPGVDTVVVGGNVVPSAFNPNTMLFLPAAGSRNLANGAFSGPGVGLYWSSTPNGTSNAWFLSFASGYANVGNLSRAFGFSVRCVSE